MIDVTDFYLIFNSQPLEHFTGSMVKGLTDMVHVPMSIISIDSKLSKTFSK